MLTFIMLGGTPKSRGDRYLEVWRALHRLVPDSHITLNTDVGLTFEHMGKDRTIGICLADSECFLMMNTNKYDGVFVVPDTAILDKSAMKQVLDVCA